MPRKLEDVLRSRRLKNEAIIRLTHFRDELNDIQELTQVLENACTAIEIPKYLHTNAYLAAMVWRKLRNVELGLKGVQKLLR